VATADDGRRITQHNNGGGYAELLIAHEWYCQPVFASASSTELSVFVSEGAVGMGCAFGVAPIEPASDVVVFGCGPVGLSAIQGARIKGATRIIAVEPIAARREVARRVGATDVINPADYFKKDDLEAVAGAGQETDGLVLKIRDMCKGPVDRPFAGGRFPNMNRNAVGPDYVIEAVGGDCWLPATGPSPDPNGILSLTQAWKLNSSSGHLATCSVFQQGNISFTGAGWSNGAKAQHPGNMNGVNTMRDMQRFARLVDSGQFNAKALVAETCTLDRIKETYLKVAERSIVGAAVTFG
jgi:S-(hydroxymethyl)glutathione dehydrogenase/alcohol dehydrogenase